MSKHPMISVLGDGQLVPGFKNMILVVGREANFLGEGGPDIGPYDLKGTPRCGFWNTAHKLIGELLDPKLSTRELKARLLGNGPGNERSPIAFADISPIPLRMERQDKDEIRSSIPEKIRAHVDALAAHPFVKTRVGVVIIGSGYKKELAEGENRLMDRIRSLDIKVVHTRFLYPTNWPRIIQELQSIDAAVVADVRRLMLPFLK